MIYLHDFSVQNVQSLSSYLRGFLLRRNDKILDNWEKLKKMISFNSTKNTIFSFAKSPNLTPKTNENYDSPIAIIPFTYYQYIQPNYC